MPAMAPSHAHVQPAELTIYSDCQSAVRTARANIAATQDPTNGATHFNFRNGPSQAAFEGHPIRTSVGPLVNSYPTVVLPATNIYANTYQ